MFVLAKFLQANLMKHLSVTNALAYFAYPCESNYWAHFLVRKEMAIDKRTSLFCRVVNEGEIFMTMTLGHSLIFNFETLQRF